MTEKIIQDAAFDIKKKSVEEESEDFMSPYMLYENLINEIKKYHPSTNLSAVEKAYKIADKAHKGQKRKSGEPYIIHPLCVAIILAQLELDKETIIAGLLHDVVEDTVMTSEDVTKEFGAEVALLVDGVTKLTQLNYQHDKIEVQAENLRKMFLAMAKDIRVIMIKLADRLHNMRTMQFQTPAKQVEKSRETMEIYAPIAHRLGISKIKVELDDLSMKYIMPDVYNDLVTQVNINRPGREAFIKSIIKEVGMHISNAGIEAEIDGRVKHFFSIYRKMVNQNKTLDQIFDIFAVRIKVDTVKDCYAALGVIHEMYKPIPGRFKDYIAMPKPNMYQSLHTTLIASNGQPFEIQIRTYEMHRTAEYGIAAHWKYKEGKGGNDNEEAKLSWLRQMLEWQTEMSDNKEFLSSIKNDLDLFSDNIYCFTPSGDVKNLPSGSCPVDFAYSIHSAVGNKMIGARVNGQLVPIDYRLKNGDRGEIITSQNGKGHVLSDINKPEVVEKTLRKYGFRDWDSMMAAIGHGSLKEGQIINKLVEETEKLNKENITDKQVLEDIVKTEVKNKNIPSKNKGNIVVKGIHDVAVRFSKCCNPVPGDEIVGFVTRGRGVTIHRTDCVNVINFPESERVRLIEAEWEGAVNPSETYSAEINIFAHNRTGLIVDISRIFTEANIDVKMLNSRVNKKDIATISVGFDIHGRDELTRMIEKLKNIAGVTDIARATG